MVSKITYTSSLSVERWQEYKEFYLMALISEPSAFSDSIEEIQNLKEDDWKRKLQKAINMELILVFAEMEGKIIGMGAVNFHKNAKLKHNAFLSTLYVEKKYRSQGIGSELIQKRIEMIKTIKGLKNIFCEITETQIESIELHKNLNFEIIGAFKELIFIDGIFYNEICLQYNP